MMLSRLRECKHGHLLLSEDDVTKKGQCRECRRAYSKKYRESHKEYAREYNKKYRESHKEYSKKYRESNPANKEAQSSRNRRYHAANKEKINERQRAYHKENAERLLARNRRWRLTNSEQVRQRFRAYTETLSPGYLARLLKLPLADCPPELLELKRLHVTLKREIKNERQHCSTRGNHLSERPANHLSG